MSIKQKILRTKELDFQNVPAKTIAEKLAAEFGGTFKGNLNYYYTNRSLWAAEKASQKEPEPLLMDFSALGGNRLPAATVTVSYGGEDETEVPSVVPHYCPRCGVDLHFVALALSKT